MARHTVYVTEDMKKEMANHDLNWSAIAQEAWRRAIAKDIRRDWLVLDTGQVKVKRKRMAINA